MEMLAIITALSIIMWYLIDRFKPLWENNLYSKYITIGVACVLACIIVFSFAIDLIYALQLVSNITIAGQILTVLILMSGSSAVSEIISRIKGNN